MTPTPKNSHQIGWVLVAASVAVLTLAFATPRAATAEASDTMLTALALLAIALVGAAATFLVGGRARREPARLHDDR